MSINQSSNSQFIQGQFISTTGTSSSPYNGLWPKASDSLGYIMEWPIKEDKESLFLLIKNNDINNILFKIATHKFEQKTNEKAINFVLLKGSVEEIMQLMPALSGANVRFSQKSKANKIILEKLKEKVNDNKIINVFINNYMNNSCIDDVEVFKIAFDNKNIDLILSTLCRDDVTEYIRENNLSTEVDDLFIKNDPKDLFQYFMFSETFDKKRFYKHIVSFNNDELLRVFISNFYPEMQKKQEMLR